MRFTRIMWSGRPRLAVVDGDDLVPLDRDLRPEDLTGDGLGTVEIAGRPRAGIADAEFLVPVPTPGKIIAVGLNYLDHTAEVTQEAPGAPLLFAKTVNTLLAHEGTVAFDRAITSQVDFEGELALVIGRTAAKVSVADALGHVFAYTIGNDVSARDVQFADGQWMRGKSLDTFCPLGPYLVPAAEIPDPQRLTIETRVNGEIMQRESTAEMIFGVAEIISYVSRSITLEPGDVILTGTPAGVGFARTPPVFLTDGDEVTVTIEPLGTLRNTVRVDGAEPAAGTPGLAGALPDPV